MKRSTKVGLLIAFCAVGWLQQRYEKLADQADYEARCAEIWRTQIIQRHRVQVPSGRTYHYRRGADVIRKKAP